MTTSFITKPDNFLVQKILLIFVFLCFLKSAFFFKYIYHQSTTPLPTNINADLRNEHYLRGKMMNQTTLKKLCHLILNNVLAENINYINERNDKFRKLFIIMTLLIISSIFLAPTTLLI